MDYQRKSEIELKYFLERRLVAVAGGSGHGKEAPPLGHGLIDESPRPKNKYQQKLSAAKNVANQSRLKKSSSCNELVLQFEQHLQSQFQPSPLFRKPMPSEVFVDPASAAAAQRQARRPLMANRDLLEKQLDARRLLPPDPVQRIVSQHSPVVRNPEKVEGHKQEANPHKVVIYFGDSIGNNRKTSGSVGDLVFASRAPDERDAAPRKRSDAAPAARTESNDVMKQLKSVLEEKKSQKKETKVPIKPAPAAPPPPPPPPMPTARTSLDMQRPPPLEAAQTTNKPAAREKPPRKDKPPKQGNNSAVPDKRCESQEVSAEDAVLTRSADLPDFVESVTDGVINIKIDGSFSAAKQLVESVAMGGENKSKSAANVDSANEPLSFDWSFVQEWRSRYLDSHSFARSGSRSPNLCARSAISIPRRRHRIQ